MCSPHSADLASQHIEWCLRGLRDFWVMLCCLWQPLQCVGEIKWVILRTGSWGLMPRFSPSVLCCLCSHALNLFSRFVCFSSLRLPLMFKHRSPGSQTSKRATIRYQEHPLLAESLWIPFWPVGSLLEGKQPICPENASIWTQSAGATFLWKWKQLL